MTTVLLAAVGIYGIRAFFLVTAGRFALPPRVEALLQHTRPAVFGALLAGGVVDAAPPSMPDPTGLAVLAVVALAARRGTMTHMVIAGMATIAAVGMLA